MDKLHDRQIRSVATVRTNRKNLPPLKQDRDMKAGDVNPNIHSTGKITCCQWKDKRVVTLISNFINPFEQTTRRRKQKGTREREEVNLPAMVRLYNLYMGGVDLADQLKECYEIDHRSRYKYYLRLFFDMIDMAVCNAYIVYKEHNPGSKLSSKEFRQCIVRNLVAGFSTRLRSSGDTCGTKKRRLDTPTSHSHLPVFTNERRRCYHCSSRASNTRSNVKCDTCDKYLCLNGNRNCFYDFHK